MCKVLKLSRSSYYALQKKKPGKWVTENATLKKEIMSIYMSSKRRYGAHKIHKSLIKKGINISVKRTQRLMRDLNVASITVKKYKPYSSKAIVDSKVNILNRNFKTTGVNEKWVTDITYIHTQQDGWCYLAVVMDLFSRKIVGYALSRRIDSDLVIKALNNATTTRKIMTSLILHSDLGSQFTSNAYQGYVEKNELIRHSFSAKGCPYDNAAIESFFSILKKEEVSRKIYKNYYEVKLSVFEFIESWYNLNRIHSSLNYLTPNEMERLVA
jgi:transposase InsO family protein